METRNVCPPSEVLTEEGTISQALGQDGGLFLIGQELVKVRAYSRQHITWKVFTPRRVYGFERWA